MRSVAQTSEQLLDLLLSNDKDTNNDKIERLMQELIDAKVEFDPRKCLEGPLYAVAYQYGPTPFWIKYSKWSPNKNKVNIEGQQLTAAGDKEGQYDAIAYGEFFGKAVTVKVIGVCSPEERTGNLLSNFFSNNKERCPADFVIQVSNIKLCLFDKPIDLGITGTGKLRVLYADPKLRIFYAPEDSNYEEAGLTVVQVRVDLLDPDFPRRLSP